MLILSAWSRLRQEYGGDAISDPAILKEYETEQAGLAFNLVASYIPFWTGFSVLFSCWSMHSGHMTIFECLATISPQVFTLGTSVCLHDFANKDIRVYGYALQLAFYLSNLALQSLCATEDMDQRLEQDRRYFMFMGAGIFFVAVLGYLTDRLFHLLVCPAMALSWLTYHHNAGQLDFRAMMWAVAILAFAAGVRGVVNAVQKQTFLTARELGRTRENLQRVTKSHQSMLDKIFDASCVCDASGCIKQASRQASQLLPSRGETLVGERFDALGATPRERVRLANFLQNAWKAGAGAEEGGELKPSQIQACLFRRSAPGRFGFGSSLGKAHQRDSCEVKIFCARLPVAHMHNPSTSLRAESDLLLCLQEVVDSPSRRDADALGRSENHEIVFDAGSANLDVISCSRLLRCAGLGETPCGLLDLAPEFPFKSKKEMAKLIDDWVYNEVKQNTISQTPLSRVSRYFSLDIPPSRGLRLRAKEVHLRFSGLERVEADIPVALHLRGVSVDPIQKGGARPCAARPPDKLVTIRETTSVHEGDRVDAHSISDGTCTLLPGDSISLRS